MDEIERRAILDALGRTGGNRTQAAETLGNRASDPAAEAQGVQARRVRGVRVVSAPEAVNPAGRGRRRARLARARGGRGEISKLSAPPRDLATGHGNCPSLWPA